jgi:ATP-binding cassette subfamily B protein
MPILAALALGAQRILPALQQCFGAWAGISGSRTSLQTALELLDQPMPTHIPMSPPQPLPVDHQISMTNISFRYGDDKSWVIRDLNWVIPKGARVALVGATGSGKSTVIDLMMGLLSPNSGAMHVDSIALSGISLYSWQRTVAHVPQQVYLADASIAENIAFGVSRAQIDFARVKTAARQAQLSSFIESRPEGYEAMVGERGVRLSGGQRQRVGIARALYKRAKVLIFDEATSALDNLTEQAVMESIRALDRELTIILIAHRLSTVRPCDSIAILENGKIVAEGNYDALISNSEVFRRMAM